MKKLLFLILLVATISCSEEQASRMSEPISIMGKWTLGTIDDFPQSVPMTITFSEDSTVTVKTIENEIQYTEVYTISVMDSTMTWVSSSNEISTYTIRKLESNDLWLYTEYEHLEKFFR